MKYQNVIIGKLLVEPHLLFAYDLEDWEKNEYHKTLFTNERYLPKIMVECGIAPSTSEVKRNRPDLETVLDDIGFLKIKYGQQFLFIAIGEK
jgi:hypothetical protein